MFRTIRLFGLVGLVVAMFASPCLAQVGVRGDFGKDRPTSLPYLAGGDTGTHEVVGHKNNIIAILIGLAKANGGTNQQQDAMETPGLRKRIDKSTPLLLKGDAMKSSVPGPVPLKEQMKGRFKNRLKNGGK
jgi:hypothetical protein